MFEVRGLLQREAGDDAQEREMQGIAKWPKDLQSEKSSIRGQRL